MLRQLTRRPRAGRTSRALFAPRLTLARRKAVGETVGFPYRLFTKHLFNPVTTYGRGAGVGRGRGVGVSRPQAVAVAVGVAVGVCVAVAVAVGVGVGLPPQIVGR